MRRLAHIDDGLPLEDGGGISSALVIVKLLDAEARRLHQDLCQDR